MLKKEVAAEFNREPFVPLRLHLQSRRSVKIPFRNAAWLLGTEVLVFKGKKEGSVVAKGYEHVGFDKILRIEKLRPKSNGHRRRKAS
jgi:hypothetical protein